MTFEVRLFARAKDLAGADAVCVELPEGATVGALRQELARQFPKLVTLLGHSAIGIDDEFAADALTLPTSSEVALLPPVSGGTWYDHLLAAD